MKDNLYTITEKFNKKGDAEISFYFDDCKLINQHIELTDEEKEKLKSIDNAVCNCLKEFPFKPMVVLMKLVESICVLRESIKEIESG